MNSFRPPVLAFVIGLLLATSPNSRAELIEAEGSASISAWGWERAYAIALQNATEDAAMQVGVHIDAATKSGGNHVKLESSRIRSATSAQKINVLNQWQQGDNLYVRISAEAILSKTLNTSVQRYRKKIVVAPFYMRTTDSSDDIDHPAHGFVTELLRQLERENRFLAKQSPYAASAGFPSVNQDNAAIARLAFLHDSQFLITGEIIDTGISQSGGHFSFLYQKERSFELDLFIYDGVTGTLIDRHRISKFAKGDVIIGRDKPFGSERFYATNFGETIKDVIAETVEKISENLNRLPFMAKVIHVTDGKIYVDAGGTSLIAPGDKMVAYQIKQELPLNSLNTSMQYGITETPVGTVTVLQVQPLFSICELLLINSNQVVKAGDFVRFESVSHDK